MSIAEKIIAGDVRSAARLIRDIDDGIPEARKELKNLYPHTGNAYIIGITGAPGVGKSTLVDRFIQHIRARGQTIGVLGVDPTSPFSGGAILGDRIRMQRHSGDQGVFIRSLATRGHFGGLTPSTRSIINVLDAMGKDIILVETVGVGQDEIDVMQSSHTTIIVLVPGMGDDVQAIKAGILEVGDLFVVNKKEREGADRTVSDIKSMLEMGVTGKKDTRWVPPVLKTEAVKNEGVDLVLEEVERHRRYLLGNGGKHLQEHLHGKMKIELLDLVKQRIIDSFLGAIEQSGELDKVIDELVQKKLDPYTACDLIVGNHLKK